VSSFAVEVTGLDKLVATFGRMRHGALPAVDAVVARGAGNIQRGARRRVAGLAHAPAYPASITFDLFHTPFTSQAEIGPDKDLRQGALGNILNFGTVKNAPVPHLFPAAEEEAPLFERAIADAAVAQWNRL
jgi:hypothetical protein